MGTFNSAVITARGQALMAKVISGKTKFNFTRIAVSDQNNSSADLASLISIGTIRQSATIASIVTVNSANVKVSASFSNEKLTAGYYVRTIGLYATDPDLGEILYSVSTANESNAVADWMPPFNGIGSSSLEVNLVTAVSNAANVTVNVDPAALATVTQIKTLQAEIDTLASFVGYEENDVYGVEVDYQNNKFTRLAGAENLEAGSDFDSLTPWGGRKRCIVTDEGVMLAYRGETGYTETGSLTTAVTKDGTEYAVGTKVQVMVEQPIFYVKTVPVKTKAATSGKGKELLVARYYVSPNPKTGFKAPELFKDDNGILQDKVYLSAFEASIFDTSAGAYLNNDEQVADFAADKLSSIAGAKPCSGLTQNLTRANTRKLANNRGDGWQQHNIFAVCATMYLFLVEYASFDCQRKIGRGVCDLTDDGSTNMAVNTGATSSLGNGSGNAEGGVNGKCSVSYRGEENLWANIWTFLDFINVLAKGVNDAYIHKTGESVADDTTTGYENFGTQLSHGNGYQSRMGYNEEYPELFLPTAAAGTDANPVGAYYYQNYTHNGFFIAEFGGKWDHGSMCGWCLCVTDASSYRGRKVGGRLLYVPQTKVA